MKPATSTIVYNSQEDKKFQLDRTAQMRSFSKEQAVFAQNFSFGSVYLAGYFVDKLSLLYFRINHWDQVRFRFQTSTSIPNIEDNLEYEERERNMLFRCNISSSNT